MSNKKQILILFAHPSQHRSEVNLPLFKASQHSEHVTAIDLYAEYPTYCIDIEREQQRLLDHEVVIFMFPLYWYSTPALLKEWQDLVLEHGFAYGAGGTKLHGKQFLCALTAGGPEKAFHPGGYNHFTIRELLQPLEQTAALTGMHYIPPFALFGSRTAAEEGRVPHHVLSWQRLLSALINDELNLVEVRHLNTINEFVEQMEREAL